MTEKRNESRVDDFYSSVQDRIILAPFVQMGLSLRDAGTAVSVARGIIEDMESVDTLGSLAIREQLASVTRERDEAVSRVGELEVECRTLHDKLDALEHPSCSRCGCLLIPDNGPWKCEGGCVADPDVCDD